MNKAYQTYNASWVLERLVKRLARYLLFWPLYILTFPVLILGDWLQEMLRRWRV